MIKKVSGAGAQLQVAGENDSPGKLIIMPRVLFQWLKRLFVVLNCFLLCPKTSESAAERAPCGPQQRSRSLHAPENLLRRQARLLREKEIIFLNDQLHFVNVAFVSVHLLAVAPSPTATVVFFRLPTAPSRHRGSFLRLLHPVSISSPPQPRARVVVQPFGLPALFCTVHAHKVMVHVHHQTCQRAAQM